MTRRRRLFGQALSGLEIDRQFEMGRLLERQVGRTVAAQDLVDQHGGALEIVADDRTMGEKPTRFSVIAQRIDRGQPERSASAMTRRRSPKNNGESCTTIARSPSAAAAANAVSSLSGRLA